MNGFEVARRLRVRPSPRPLLVAVSGYGQQADLERSAAAGFDRHFVKPIDMPALSSLLAEHADAVERDVVDMNPSAS